MDQFLFSHESPDAYPSITLPVAYYINQNCPEIVEKATTMLIESRCSTPMSTTTSESTSSSPFRSMGKSSQSLSLPQTVIGGATSVKRDSNANTIKKDTVLPLANYVKSNDDKSTLVATHRSSIVGDDLLSELESSRSSLKSLQMDEISNFSFCDNESSIYSEVVMKSINESRNIEIQTDDQSFDQLRLKINSDEQINALKNDIAVAMATESKLKETIATLERRLCVATETVAVSDGEKTIVANELKSLKLEYEQWKNVLNEYDDVIENKMADVKALKCDLATSECKAEKFNVCLEEAKIELQTKDGAVQGLKNKIAELHVANQTMLNEKVHLENDIDSLKNEKETIKKSKEWYSGQLHQAQENKNELHKELIATRAEYAAVYVNMERLRSENENLRVDLSELAAKNVKEKEVLMKHLENIEADMLERESIFHQMEQDKGSADELISTRLKRLEEEQSKLTNLKLKATDLEFANRAAVKSNADLRRHLEEAERDKNRLATDLAELRRNMADREILSSKTEREKTQCEMLLVHVQGQLKVEEGKVEELKRDKTMAEIGLLAANNEKREVNEALKILQGNLSELEGNFKHMHSELINKTSKLAQLMNENQRLEDSIQLTEKQLLHQKLTFQQQTSIEHQTSDVRLDDVKKQSIEMAKVVDTLKLDLRRQEQRNCDLKRSNEVNRDQAIQLMHKVKELEKANEALARQPLPREPEVYKLQSMMETNEAEFKTRIRVYENNIKVLTRKLRKTMKKEKLIEAGGNSISVQTEHNLNSAPIAMDEQSISDVEKMLERYKEQVEFLERESSLPCRLCKDKESILSSLESSVLQLEKENGQLKGSMGGEEVVREIIKRLETNLAEKDSKMAAVQLESDQTKRKLETELSRLKEQVATLQAEINKEKTVAKDLRYQIFQEKREVKQLKTQSNSIRSRLDQSGSECEHQRHLVSKLSTELDDKLREELRCKAELQQTQNSLKQSHLRVKCLEDQIVEVQSRDPTMAEQMKTLSWHLKEKNQEISLLKTQQTLLEQRCQNDKETNHKQLNSMQADMLELKSELMIARKEKFALQSKVSELKGALRSSVNMAKNLRCNQEKSMSSTDLGVCIPQSPAPYDESFINSLLKQSLTLPESRPLSNLQACLNSLKQEMNVLQQQVENRSK